MLSAIDMLTNYSVANKMYYGPVVLTLLNKHYYYYNYMNWHIASLHASS